MTSCLMSEQQHLSANILVRALSVSATSPSSRASTAASSCPRLAGSPAAATAADHSEEAAAVLDTELDSSN